MSELTNCFGNEWNQRKVPRAFYRLYELPLVPCTRTGDPLGNNFSLFGDESAQSLLIFVIDVDFLIVAETTGPAFLNFLVLFCHESMLWLGVMFLVILSMFVLSKAAPLRS